MLKECRNKEIHPGDFVLYKFDYKGKSLYGLVQNIEDDFYTDGVEKFDLSFLTYKNTSGIDYLYKIKELSPVIKSNFHKGLYTKEELSKYESPISDGVYKDYLGQVLHPGDIVIKSWNKQGGDLGIVSGYGEVVNKLGQVRKPLKVVKLDDIYDNEREELLIGFNYYINLYSNFEGKKEVDTPKFIYDSTKGDVYLVDSKLIIYLGGLVFNVCCNGDNYKFSDKSNFVIKMNLNILDKLSFIDSIRNAEDEGKINSALQRFILNAFNTYKFNGVLNKILLSKDVADEYSKCNFSDILRCFNKYIKRFSRQLEYSIVSPIYYVGHIDLENIKYEKDENSVELKLK